MTGNTSTNVRARVDYYDHDKQFGFAVTQDGQRMWFHQSACRMVVGTPEEPALTKQPSAQAPRWFRRISNPSEILISRVVRGAKGPKADTWGIIPVRTWLEELELSGKLDSYVGGKVTILRSSRDGLEKKQGRLLSAPQLDARTEVLHLSFMWCDEFGRPKCKLDTVHSMELASEERGKRHGVLALRLYEGNDRMQIAFYPPSEG